MNQRRLGTTDIFVSEVGFGCMSLQLTDPKADADVLREAVDRGITFFDTADLYNHGRNEEVVGKALRENRKQVVIATKVGNQWRKDRTGWDWNPGKEHILKAVEASLQRLKTDYIDLYQLHGGTLDDPIDETLEAFEILVKQGKIRSYGISSIRPSVISRWIEMSNFSSCMMQYGLLDRRPEEQALGILNEASVALLARGALGKGALIRPGNKSFLDYQLSELEQIREVISPNTQKGFNIALSYPLQRKGVASCVIGIRNREQLLTAANFHVTEVPERVNQFLKEQQYSAHRI